MKSSQPSKLQTKFRQRPMQVMKVLPGDTYRMTEGDSDGQEVYATTIHVNQPKSFKILQHADEEDPSENDSEGDVRRQSDEEDELKAQPNGEVVTTV